ncbi:MAG: cytochrome C, partial [Deltaproteobacteria bacterium]
TQEHARGCLGCHGSEKAAGYGIEGGRLFGDQSKPFVVEFTSPDGRLVLDDPFEISGGMDGLAGDWSRFVTEEGRQLQTVGHHLPLSGPLAAKQRALLNRRGVCLACHRDIPGSIDVRLLNHVAAALGMLPESDAEHSSLLRKTLHIAGWVQVVGPFAAGLLLLLCFVRFRRRRAAGKR